MHKTILEYPSARADADEASGNHTHVLSDVPENMSVFVVLAKQLRLPEIVVIHMYMYTIDIRGKISQ